ncbi:MAG: hypothetical protein U0441_18130 [Polyangiaceae bacterium]
MKLFGAFFVAACISLTACAPPAAITPPKPPTLAEWRSALADLRALKIAASGEGPRTLKLALAMREPFTGRRTEARGAVALSPEQRAVRMILVGPGGTTAFDLWMAADRFRVSVPAIDLLRRGDASTPRAEMRGLPVDFLRFWLLDPTRGDLRWAERAPERTRYWLRDGAAIVTLDVAKTGAVTAERRTWLPAKDGAPLVLLDDEKVTADKFGCGRAHYTQASTGVEIDITCEGVEPSPPSERAFLDPDAPEPEESE